MSGLCDARAVRGRCALPAGHNRGRADVPENHTSISTDNLDRLRRAVATVAGLTPSIRQWRLLTWLSGWDRETVNTLSQIIEEAYSAGFCDGLGLGEPE